MTTLQIGTNALVAVKEGLFSAYSGFLPAVVVYLVALFPMLLFVRFIFRKINDRKTGFSTSSHSSDYFANGFHKSSNPDDLFYDPNYKGDYK